MSYSIIVTKSTIQKEHIKEGDTLEFRGVVQFIDNGRHSIAWEGTFKAQLERIEETNRPDIDRLHICKIQATPDTVHLKGKVVLTFYFTTQQTYLPANINEPI